MENVPVAQLMDALLIAIILTFTGFLLWLGHKSYKASLQVRMQRAQSFNALLERFSSAKEFTDFLQTEEGKRFITDPLPAARGYVVKVLRFVQYGVVFVAIGVGLLFNAYRLRDATDLHYASQAKDCQFWGTLGVAVGISLVVIALVSYFIAKKWHLLNGNGNGKHLSA